MFWVFFFYFCDAGCLHLQLWETRFKRNTHKVDPLDFFNLCYKYNALRHYGLHNTDRRYIILCNKHCLKHFQKPRGQPFFHVTYSHGYIQKPNFSVFGQQDYTDITTITNQVSLKQMFPIFALTQQISFFH